MGHVNTYRDRQYFAHELTGHEVSEGIKKVGNTFLNNVNTAISITQKANESTLANNQIDLSAKFLAKNNEINTKYQADPTNPQREVELQQAFDSLASQYKINPLCQKQWADIKSNVYNRYKTYNAQWQVQQQQTNIQTNLKNGYENLTNQVSMLGMNGAGIDEMRLVYANGIEGLRNGAIAGLGEVYVNDFLRDSNHDIMTTYISSLALNNPLKAQELLQDEGVRNDIGKAETIEKLESYVANSLANQSKKTAVNELCSALRAMNSEEADNIINGKADLSKIMKFTETNKSLPEGSKDIIFDIYGIGTKQDYYYDRNKKIITKDPEGGRRGGGGSGVSTKKMTALDKKMLSETLEQDLHNLLSFDEFDVNDVKTVKKNKEQQKASDGLIGYMKNIAQMQERIDTAYNAGAITKDDRKRMMNQYIAPVSDYIEQNLEQLDEKSIAGIAGKKLGYDQIKQRFNTEGLKGNELKSMQKQKLFAQNYYLDELYKASQKLGLGNIYEIESLKPTQQKEIYKTASENALQRAKRWTDEPEIFFAKEYPEISMQPSVYFKANEAKMINRAVAQEVFKREFENPDGTSKLDLKDYAQIKCAEEIQKKYRENQIKAGQTMGSIQTGDYKIHAPLPKSYAELERELKNMGYTINDFHEFAVQNGYVERLNNRQWRQGGYLNQWYMNALLDLRQAKSIKK